MPGHRFLPRIAVFVLLLHAAACSQPEHEELRGSLYFVTGKYLASLDLRDGSTSVVANLGDVDIRSLSPQLEDRILLSVHGGETDKETRHLVLYDIETRQTLTLLNGRNGHYLPGTKTLVYDDGVRIYLTERIRGSWEKTEVARHRYNQGIDILPVSSSRFIYRVGDGPLFVYDKTAARSIELGGLASACRFERLLWFADREQMLCQVPGDGQVFEYRFVALDGSLGEALPLPAENDLKPLVLLPDQDVLILTERWRSGLANRVRWGVWAYDLATQEAYRLFDDQHLGEYVLYSPD
jgi:hypothetical protein